MRSAIHLILALWLAAATATASWAGPRDAAARVLVIGDSLLAWHSLAGDSVADNLARLLGAPVEDRSVAAARMIYALPVTGAMGLSIPRQFRKRDQGFDWVVINGGGNDLWLGCGCDGCERRMTRLIAAGGADGAIPKLIARIRATGARVAYVGYLRSPGFDSPIEACRDEGDVLEARLAAMAARDPGVTFLAISDLVPHGDTSFHALDRIHPSRKASRAIARRLAALLAQP